MIRNYIKIAIRNLTKNAIYSFINIAGLSVGLTAFILVVLWIQHEVSYDRFHTHRERIYRVVENQYYANSAGSNQLELFPVAVTPAPLAPYLEANFPEIENTFRMSQNRFLFIHEDKRFNEEGLLADPSIFEILTFDFVKGNDQSPLADLNSIVVSEKLAAKYFDGEDPIGQVFRINNNDFKITAVVSPFPQNSHLQFDFIMPFEMIKKFGWNSLDLWGNNGFYTYALLQGNVQLENVNVKIKDAIKKNATNFTTTAEVYLQPLTDIHLRSQFTADIQGHGDIQYIYIFSAIGVFVLLIACINFMNLSTARSMKRAREVGLRKVIGALRAQLVRQFLAESFVLTVAAVMLALFFCQLLLPVFSEISGKDVALNFKSPAIWIVLLSIVMVTSLVSGSYPAFFLSAFKPVHALKGAFKTGQGAVRFRKALVVVQFSLSIILITGTLLIYDQLSFIRNKNLGFEKENIIGFSGWSLRSQFTEFRNELLKHPEISGVTISSSELTYVGSSNTGFEWEGKDPDNDILIHQLSVDTEFIKTFGIGLAAGRDFSADLASDSSAVILNEEAIRAMGIDQPIGKRFGAGTIIGVAKDFHFKSVRDKIEPLVMFIDPTWYGRINVKFKPGSTEQGLANAAAVYKQFRPDSPFEYTFLDEDFEAQYRAEQRTGKIFNYFAFVAVFISSLGLFGLVMFTTEQRTKEIGIRKVLGASVRQIFSNISSDFIRLVVIANLIAVPIAWYVMDIWLKGFAYKTEISWVTFAIATISSLAIAWLTMSYQSIKAATADPVKSLRDQ